MLEQLSAELKSGGNVIQNLKALLEEYYDKREYWSNAIGEYDKELQSARSQSNKQFIQRVKEFGTEILITNALLAAENTKEFDLPEFNGRLVQAIRDDRTISILVQNDDPLIIINLEVTAGNLSDYFSGVDAARSNKGLGKTRGKFITDPKANAVGEELSSRIWREKIYGSAREGASISRKNKKGESVNLSGKYKQQYQETIDARLNAFSSTAPWWYILEYGTPQAGYGDGKPYPSFSGQHFVENSLLSIKNAYKSIWATYVNEVNSMYNKIFSDIHKNIQEINKIIKEITEKIAECLSFSYEKDVETAYTAIKSKLAGVNIDIKKADPRKIAKLAYDLMEGTPISSSLRLGAGIRIRTIRLRQEFEKMLTERIL